ncbi:MAG: ABC transporter permease [Tannerella sp.]|jgi:putative ABC transport system permease protein|nr:ABC transporter permease [Tannerella sp.]
MKQLHYTLRYLFRVKGNNLIKVISLTLGLVVALVLFSKVAFEMSYDKFYPEADRIYQLNVRWDIKNSGVSEQDIINAPFAPTMFQEMDEVVAGTAMYAWPEEVLFKVGDKEIKGDHLLVDSMFLKTFGIELLAGNPLDVAQPMATFISETMAINAFGNEDPVGRSLDIEGGSVTVNGVFADIPANSHLKFDVMKVADLTMFGGWQNQDVFRGYVKLAPGVDYKTVEAKIPDMMRRHYDVDGEIQKGRVRTFYLKPVADVHTRNPEVIRTNVVLSILAFALLFAAAMNYVLISVSSLAKRTKSIGIHKCSGASNRNVFSMFMYETGLLTIISLILAFLLILAFRGQIEMLLKSELFSIFSLQNLWVTAVVLVFLFLTTGFIPAKIFSSVPVTQVFRTNKGGKKQWKGLLLFAQFFGIAFMLTLLIIIMYQYQMVMNRNMGYITKDVVYSENTWKLDEEQLKTAKAEFERLPEIASVTITSAVPANGMSGSPVINNETKEDLFTGRFLTADQDYFKTFGIPLVDGRDFTDNSINTNEIIVNETLARLLHVDNLIGHRIEYLGKERIICGIVKDYQTQTFYSEIPPLVIFPAFTEAEYTFTNIITMRLNTPLTNERLDELSGKLKVLSHSEDVSFISYANLLYGEGYGEVRLFRNAVMTAALIMLIITLIGLFGFVADEVSQRQKEIAVRKVNGARAKDILYLLFVGISYVAVPAIILGLLFSYAVGAEWLQQFAVKVPLNMILFILSGLSILTVLLFSVVTRSWSVAHENPVTYLKME